MSEIVEHMKFISRFFPKGDDPLKFPDCEGSVGTDDCDVVSAESASFDSSKVTLTESLFHIDQSLRMLTD